MSFLSRLKDLRVLMGNINCFKAFIDFLVLTYMCYEITLNESF